MSRIAVQTPASRRQADAYDLAFVADALLAICGSDEEHPFFTGEAEERRRRRDLKRSKSYDHAPALRLAAKQELAHLDSEIHDILRLARLTASQEEAFNLRMLGYSFEEIGAMRRTCKQAAQHSFAQGLKKIWRAREEYRFSGLHSVYRAEVQRTGRRTLR